MTIYVGDSNGIARTVKAVYVGDSNGIAREVTSMYVGDSNGIARSVWSGNGLPDIYQQVEYILSDGNQYIDTGIKVSGGHTIIDLNFLMPNKSAAYYVFGSGSANADKLCFVMRDTDHKFVLYYYSTNVGFRPTVQLTTVYHLIVDLINYQTTLQNETLTLNETLALNETYASKINSQTNLALFVITNGSFVFPSIVRLYKCKIYDGDTLLRNFYPCYLKSDPTMVGLYDIKGRSFYGNLGTGSFTAGPDYEGEL